jgi:hypothetical protein
VLSHGRIGESFGYTETGCIVERVGHKAGCCIEVREQRRRCVGRRGLDVLLHIYFISMSAYLPHISASAIEGFVELWSKSRVED